jgi:TonB family protein
MLTNSTKLLMAWSIVCATGEAQAATITHKKLDTTIGIISIEGDIVSGDLERFRQVSLQYPKAIVLLNSNGGRIYPAIEIGKIIKVMGYVTMVEYDDVCASACALIWMAGDKRGMSASGHVGFHAAYRDENGEPIESGSANALIGNYLTVLGVSAKTVVFATTAPPDRMLWLTDANKNAAGIDFETIAPAGRVAASMQTLPLRVPVPAVLLPSMPVAPRSASPDNRQNAQRSLPPRPLTAPSGWVSWDDAEKALGISYRNLSPTISLSVRFVVDVNSSGRVFRCRVVTSSGLPALDDATCRAISKRAAFIPATDPFGNTVTGTFIHSVRWK